MNTTPFKPVTREEAVEILSSSLTTLDALIAKGVLPAPRPLGECRKLYWHPDVFFAALNRWLWVDPASIAPPASETPEATQGTPQGNAEKRSADAVARNDCAAPIGPRRLRDPRTRQAERLKKLNR